MIALISTISSIPEMEKLDLYISDIAQGKDGHAALEKIYISTKDAVYGYALSILKNSHDAEDVLHDCYITLYQSAGSYNSKGKPMAWIFTIARNLCMDTLRDRSRVSDIPEEDWEKNISQNGNIGMEDQMVLKSCMSKLSDDEREIMLLHILSGMKHREIAALMDRPLATILSKYNRAIKKMKTLLTGGDSYHG